MTDAFKKIVDIIVDVADILAETIKEDSLLIDDLDLASLEILSIVSKIEEEYSIIISEKDLLAVQTVNDIVKLVAAS